MTDETPRPSPAAPSRDRWSRQVIGPFTLKHIVVLLGSLLGVGMVLTVLTTPLSPPAATPPPQPGASFVIVGEATEGLAIGQRAPELEGIRDGQVVGLLDLDGDPVRLADLAGRPVWVNFWASWCPPCQEETPVLRAMDQRYRDAGLAIVAVSVQESSPADVRQYAETYDLDYTIGFDARSEVFRAWLGFGLPTHYFLDGEGIVRVRHYGPLSMIQATAIIEALLPAATPVPTG